MKITAYGVFYRPIDEIKENLIGEGASEYRIFRTEKDARRWIDQYGHLANAIKEIRKVIITEAQEG